MTNSNPITACAATSQELSYIERLLLHALRVWVARRDRWPEIVLEFNRACGPLPATRICETLQDLFHVLGIHARHRIRLCPMVCCHVSHDELCLLNLVAAQQDGAVVHADALTRWLVGNGAIDCVDAHTRTVAQHLYETGYTLERRYLDTVALPEQTPVRQLVH
ncbi:MAG: hypothetical protein CL566_10095 [Alphaproteobacteria bacterium]|nr:hypothetical protein [Alphaproteobacteria bacterium]|tara:strand:- start:1470 stop:1961 length:492 start_codon:yes stop_codon:yes gene_type:complete